MYQIGYGITQFSPSLKSLDTSIPTIIIHNTNVPYDDAPNIPYNIIPHYVPLRDFSLAAISLRYMRRGNFGSIAPVLSCNFIWFPVFMPFYT